MKSSTLTTILLTLLTVALVAAAGFTGYTLAQRSADETTTTSGQNDAKSQDSHADAQNDAAHHEETHNAQAAATTCDGTFKINGRTMNLPTGWHVNGVDAKEHRLSDTEIAEFSQMGGSFPIFEQFKLHFTNGATNATFVYEPIFVPGGFGGVTTDLDTNVYTVVVAPTKDLDYNVSPTPEMFGIARGNGQFVLIANGGVNSPTGAQYINLSEGIGEAGYMTYTGSDVNDVQQLFDALCRENLSGYCW